MRPHSASIAATHPLRAPRAMHLTLSAHAAAHTGGAPIALALRDAALLAWLALEGPTPRARLAALLWPDSELASAHNSLRQRLFKLRKQLGADAVTGTTTLALAHGVTHDLAEADQVLGAGAPVAAGEFAAWLEQQRQRRHGRVRQSLAELCEMAETAGDWPDALSHAHELVALSPLSEEAHRRVIRLHYLSGDRAAALLAFDRCERMLKDEVGARPDAQTLALLSTIESGARSGSALAVSSAIPANMLRPPQMVGRRGELLAALHAWRDDRVFCLEGEAGMGKSRLLQEIAVHRPDAVCAQARPGDAVVPYSTLVRLLRALMARTPQVQDTSTLRSLALVLPALGAPNEMLVGTDASHRMALGQAVAERIEAARQAGVGAVIVDDLHFADDASLEMFLQLSRGGAVLQWGFARRPAEGSRGLNELVEALLEEQRLEPVPLAALTREQLAELLDTLSLPASQVAALSQTLHQHTGGNPLFVLETLRQSWVDSSLAGGRLPRPVSVTRLIERRVMRLSPAAVRLARCAAVAGVDFSIELAAVVLAVPVIDLADAWTELEQAQVFADGAFAHDLINETVRAALPRQIARHLHGEVASHLESRGAEAASVAAHWLAAGETRRALPFLRRAGETAMAQRRFGEAAATFENEAQLRLGLDDRSGAFAAAHAMRQACFELDLGDRTDAALELMQRAACTPQQRASAQAERAIVCMHRGAMLAAEEAVVAGLAALGSLAEPALRSLLNQHLAAVRVWQHRPAEAFELMRSIESDVEATCDIDRQVEFAQGYAVVLEHLDRPAESAVWYRRAADKAIAGAKLPAAAQALLNLAIGSRDSGQLDTALATLQEAQALLVSLPEGAIPYSSLDVNFGIVMRDLGRYGEALDWLDRAIERGRVHVPGWVPLFLAHRAQTWLALGQLSQAQQDLNAAAVDEAPPLARLRCELASAQLQRSLGKDAGAAFARAEAQIGVNGRALSRHRLVLMRCSVLDPAEALAAAGEVLDSALAAKRAGVMVAARTRLCEAALALGHHAEAARQARLLAELAPGDSCDELYRGEVWLAAYQALAAVDPKSAAKVLERALSWVHEVANRHVPQAFRDSFLHRNAVNSKLLAFASRNAALAAD